MARIALDIDSTLHHYWDLLAELSERRYGVALRYDEQTTWGIDALEQEQLHALVQESHRDTNVLSAEPYPDAVETVRRWHDDGHWIHVTSHRATSAHAATERWLHQIRLPYDDLHCSYDKISRCVELGIDVLVDDSPVNLAQARDHGIVGATIVHPWNAELVNSDGIVSAENWRELADRLAPVLARRPPA